MPTISFDLTDEEVNLLQDHEYKTFKYEIFPDFKSLNNLYQLGLLEYSEEYYRVSEFARIILDTINSSKNQNLFHVSKV